MNCTIPFTKDLKFPTSLAKIVSISLEHEYTVNEQNLLGNFLITGEYKTHELSVNTENFSFTVPFEVSLPEKLNKDTLEFTIENFTYETKEENIMTVNIEFKLSGEETAETERTIEDPLDLIADAKEPEKDEKPEEESKPEVIQEEKTEIKDSSLDNTISNERLETTSENNVLNVAQNSEETFVTYHIHLMKEGDSLETVMNKYKVSKELLSEYNDLEKTSIGDKLIIPCDE